MSLYLVLQAALTLGLLLLIGFVIHVLLQMNRTLRTLDDLLKNINKEVPAVLTKLELALDGVNFEIERVDDIVTSLNDVRAKVQNTSTLVHRAFSAPATKVSGLLSGFKTALGALLKSKR